MDQQRLIRSVYDALQSFHDEPIPGASPNKNMNMSDVTYIQVHNLAVIHALL